MNITYEDMDILYVYINVNYVCSIDHYNFGGSHASDIITCLNWSLLSLAQMLDISILVNDVKHHSFHFGLCGRKTETDWKPHGQPTFSLEYLMPVQGDIVLR